MLIWSSLWQTAPLQLVYGPTDNEKYQIWEQAENIRSRPETWEESLTQCMGLCTGERPPASLFALFRATPSPRSVALTRVAGSGSSCQSFSLVLRDGSQGPGTGLTTCYL